MIRMKNRKLWLSILVICSLVICIFFAKCYLEINTKYPSPKETIHEMGEELIVPKSENLIFYIKEAILIDGSEVEKLVPDFYTESKESGLEYALVLLTISLKNTSDNEQSIENLKSAMLTINNTYSNGLALTATLEMNNGNLINSVKPHQSEEIKLLYGITRINLKKSIYSHLSSQNFYFTYSLSPAIERVSLMFN